MAKQRDRRTPAQPILNCAALSPDKPIPCKNPEEGAAGSPPLPGLWPPCCSPVGRAAWPPEAEGAEAGMAQGGDGAAAPPCCPAWEEECRARQVSLCVSSGVGAAGRDRAGAARPGDPLALVVRGLLLPAPWGWFHPCVLIGATMLYNAYITSQG